MPAALENSRNSVVMTAQTVCRPTSSSEVLQQPSRKKPVSGRSLQVLVAGGDAGGKADGQAAERLAVAGGPGQVVAAYGDGTLRLWDSETGAEVTRLALDGAATAVSFAHDGRLAAGDRLGHVHVLWIVP